MSSEEIQQHIDTLDARNENRGEIAIALWEIAAQLAHANEGEGLQP